MNMKKLWVIINLAVLLFVSLPALAVQCGPGVTGVCNPSPNLVDFSTRGGQNTFLYLFTFFIQQLLVVAGVLVVFFVIISGFQYMAAGANQEWAEAGKKGLTNAIIGLVIIILSYIIVSVINNALG